MATPWSSSAPPCSLEQDNGQPSRVQEAVRRLRQVRLRTKLSTDQLLAPPVERAKVALACERFGSLDALLQPTSTTTASVVERHQHQHMEAG